MADRTAAPPVGVGLLGLGVVGGGVYRALHQNARYYAQRCGRRIEVRRVAVRDLHRPRTVPVDPALLTDDPFQAATDPGVTVVVEVMGGEHPATACIRAALDAGKHVVTANKEVMARHGPALQALAQARGVELLYEASVGGGIPIIAPLKRDLRANEIREIRAIINGTTNFILTTMAHDATAYDAALAEAQRRGYAEADPANDVEGNDARYKIAILASLAFHTDVHPDQVYCEGITALTPRDFQYAARLRHTIKLVATARRVDGRLDVRVHPTLLPETDPLARVDGVLNAVSVEGDLLGRALFEGQGAGAGPTTSAVLADLLDVVSGIAVGIPPRPLPPTDPSPGIVPIGDLVMRYYLRILVQDRPGVLAEIGRVFAEHTISIASFLQMEADAVAHTAEIVITTHPAREADMDACLAQMAGLAVVPDVGIRLRMEDPGA